MFTPDFAPGVPIDQNDGVTFEVWAGNERLYQRHVMPGEHLDSVALDLVAVRESDQVQVSFVTKPGPRSNAEFGSAVWRNVQFFVGDDRIMPGRMNVATRNPPIRLFDLPQPTAFSPELGVASVRVLGADLDAQRPSGATFLVCTNRKPLQVAFKPSFIKGSPTDQISDVTFQVWTGSTQLFERRVQPSAAVSVITLEVRGAANSDRVPVSFVIPPDARNNRSNDWVTWRDVKFFLSGPRSGCS